MNMWENNIDEVRYKCKQIRLQTTYTKNIVYAQLESWKYFKLCAYISDTKMPLKILKVLKIRHVS